MADELSQLDNIIESEILEALGQNSSNTPRSLEEDLVQNVPDEFVLTDEELAEINKNKDLGEEQEYQLEENEITESSATSDDVHSEVKSINLNNTNTNDLLSALSQLLNNKTIEITIKIKD